MQTRGGYGDGSNNWAPATHKGDLKCIPGSQLLLWSSVAAAGIWENESGKSSSCSLALALCPSTPHVYVSLPHK